MAARAGLSRERVVDAAAELVDREGAASLSLAGVARRLGVRTPSLYNHVDGLPGLLRALRLAGLRELADAVGRAALGRSGADALRAVAHAYRDHARRRPGLYAFTVRTVEGEDEELRAAARELIEVVSAVLRGYGLEGDDALHATRALRAALHGFVTLENDDAFGLDLAREESFERLVALLDAGLAGRARSEPD